MSTRYFLGVLCAAALTVGAANVSRADIFSIDSSSPSITAKSLSSGDLLGAGPLVHVPVSVLGGVSADDLDALSSGLDSVDGSDIIYFSVDRQSQGAYTLNTGDPSLDNYTVRAQALLNQQAGDIYVSVDPNGVESMPGYGMQLLMKNQRNFGLVPTGTGFSSVGQPAYNNVGKPQDDLNAYSQEEFDVFNNDFIPDRPVFFSATATSPSIVSNNQSGADILAYDPQTHTVDPFASASMIGLRQADDIDALALNLVIDFRTGDVLGGSMYFSLAPGSPSLTILGDSAADIFMLNFTYDDVNDILTPIGTFFVRYDYASLGLLFSDNVDALETNSYNIPEPATLALIAAGGLMLIHRRRKA